MTDAAELDRLIMLYAKAADGIGCERGSYLYDEIGRGLTAVLAAQQDGAREAAIEECAQVAANFVCADFEWQSEIAEAIRKLKSTPEQ